MIQLVNNSSIFFAIKSPMPSPDSTIWSAKPRLRLYRTDPGCALWQTTPPASYSTSHPRQEMHSVSKHCPSDDSLHQAGWKPGQQHMVRLADPVTPTLLQQNPENIQDASFTNIFTRNFAKQPDFARLPDKNVSINSKNNDYINYSIINSRHVF